jgi:hypothetical protein
MTLVEFQKEVFSVLNAFLDDLSANPPTETIPAPRDWPHLRSIIRAVAEDLILCADVPAAIAKLRGDRSALVAVIGLTTELISEDDALLAVKRAYASMSDDTPLLPAHPFAAYLLQLCDDLELGGTSGTTELC